MQCFFLISKGFNQALVSLYQPHLSLRWFWLELKANLYTRLEEFQLFCLYNIINVKILQHSYQFKNITSNNV